MNLVIPEAIVKLREVVAGLEADPEIQVVIFTSEVPDSQGSGGDEAALTVVSRA